MKKKGFLIKLISVILPAALLITLGIQVFAAESMDESRVYDLSKAGAVSTQTANSADILENILGERLSDAERSYLVAYGDLSVKYDSGITTAKVSAILNEDKLSVTAYRYSYTSVSGINVQWTPRSVTLGKDTKLLTASSDGFTATFDGVTDESGVAKVDVLYTMNVIIDEEDATALLNKARSDIPALEEEIGRRTAAYEHALAEYNRLNEQYLDFIEAKEQYYSDLESYKNYVSEYRQYQDKLDAYNEYLADKEIYDAELALREKYEEELEIYKTQYPLYVDYLAAAKTYETNLAEYNKYVESVKSFRNRLEILDYLNVKMTSLERSALGAINGNVVTSVLDERDSLESNLVGAPPRVIDLAGEATDNLRILLNDYFSYTTEQGRYSYYLQNYDDLKTNIVNLFISLDYLYRNSSVRAALYETERDEKYRILVAQLYLVAHAISDEPIKSVSKDLVAGSKDADGYKQFTYTSKYTMDVYKYTVSDILYKEELLVDRNSATPINSPFPTEVTEPTAPVVVEKPTEPEYVAAPNELIPVSDPGEPPTEVSDPGEPPEEVSDPGKPPKEYVPPKEYTDLISAKDSIPVRKKSFDGGCVLTFKKTVSKKFLNQEEVNVKFYSENSDVLLYETTIDAGTAADYDGAVPVKQEDDRAVYVFSGWQNAQGEVVSLSEVSTDLILYPHFEEQIKEYKIIFDVDGKKYEYILPYGQTPVFEEGEPKRDDEGTVMYKFVGWDREITPVVGDAEYFALFEQDYIAPSSQGGASVSVNENGLVLNYGIAFDRSLDISRVLERAEEAGGLVIVSPYLTLDFNYSQVLELIDSDAARITFEVTESAGSLCKYRVSLYNSKGENVEKGIGLKLVDRTAPLEENERLKLFYFDEEGNRRYTKYAIEGKKMTFSAILGREYLLSYEYTVTTATSSFASLGVDKDYYTVGDSVSLLLELPYDVKLIRLYYKTSDGKETDLRTMKFTMPNSDIILIADVEYVRYRITFVSEDTVISSIYCNRGQMPTAPEDPKKLSDDENQYTFVGWSEELTAAEGNKTYYAVFEASPIEIVEAPDKGPTIYQRAVFIAIAAGAFLVLIAIIGIGIKLQS